MNALLNKVQLIGHLGQTPELRVLNSGKKVTSFSMATNEHFRNGQGQRVTETQWHHIVAWGKTAEQAERLLKKGSRVAVEGKLTTRSYVDKDGQNRLVCEIVLSGFVLLDNKKTQATVPEEAEEELPF